MKINQQLKKELSNFVLKSLYQLESDFIDTTNYDDYEESAYSLGKELITIVETELSNYITEMKYDNVHSKSDIKLTKENLKFLFIDNLSIGYDRK